VKKKSDQGKGWGLRWRYVITINATFKCLAYRTRNYNDNDADRRTRKRFEKDIKDEAASEAGWPNRTDSH